LTGRQKTGLLSQYNKTIDMFAPENFRGALIHGLRLYPINLNRVISAEGKVDAE
jgi:hypothetical protein